MNSDKSVMNSERSVREDGDEVRELGKRSGWWKEKSIGDEAMEMMGEKEGDVNRIYENAFQFACIQPQVS